MEISDIKHDGIYKHARYGWVMVIANHWDDGATFIVQAVDSDGDDPDWYAPCYLAEACQLTPVTQQQWNERFPDMPRTLPD